MLKKIIPDFVSQ